jgi:ADP-heptose:LPS heptosyltransferase
MGTDTATADMGPTSTEDFATDEDVWVNPLGGLGDTLMLSGVLKLAVEHNPSRKYSLVRRSAYLNLLRGHPAIREIGFPPRNARAIGSDYWSKEPLGGGNQRAFQVLARAFGLPTPVEERLFLPGTLEEDPLLEAIIPWREKNILIAPASDSPRKVMDPMQWHHLVDKLLDEGFLVLQAGRPGELHIRNTYSLLGVTAPRQTIWLVDKCDLVIASDTFAVHAAHLVETPAVVVWGPTRSEVYGYSEQSHITAPLDHCDMRDKCIGPQVSENYSTPCPLGQDHCMNKISVDTIFNKAIARLWAPAG